MFNYYELTIKRKNKRNLVYVSMNVRKLRSNLIFSVVFRIHICPPGWFVYSLYSIYISILC